MCVVSSVFLPTPPPPFLPASNHTPALPGFPCSSPWVGRENASALGYRDHRVADNGALCYPAPAGFDTCWPNFHFVYEAQLSTWTGPTKGVVRVVALHADAVLTHENDTSVVEFRRACPQFFDLK